MAEQATRIRLTTGERLAVWMNRHDPKLTHAALAGLVGVSKRSVSRYVSGEISPPGVVLARIADELGVSTDYLLRRTENPTTPPYPGAFSGGRPHLDLSRRSDARRDLRVVPFSRRECGPSALGRR